MVFKLLKQPVVHAHLLVHASKSHLVPALSQNLAALSQHHARHVLFSNHVVTVAIAVTMIAVADATVVAVKNVVGGSSGKIKTVAINATSATIAATS